MTAAAKAQRRAESPAIAAFSCGFRPLFLAAAIWAIVAIALWLPMFFGQLRLPTRFDPMAWHIHEMLFGFVMAAIGGFLLTAVPNWTGRQPIRGRGLALLASLWLLGRLACLMSAALPLWLAIAADLAFMLGLLAAVGREILASRSWRNLPMTAPLAVFAAADLLMHLEADGSAIPAGLGWRLGLTAALQMISVVGARIVPAFTRNWLLARGATRLPAPRGLLDIASTGVLHAALLLWTIYPDLALTGALLLAGAALSAWRLARWRGANTLQEPLLLILHVGYGWLVAGTALLGLSIFDLGIPFPTAIHALTAGAMGIMILAVMPRVSLGHTGRELTASQRTVVIYLLANAAALARIAAPVAAGASGILLSVSGIAWAAAFALFLALYAPMLLRQQQSPP